MEQKIYQNGFFLMLGLFVGLLIGYLTFTKSSQQTLKIEFKATGIDSKKSSIKLSEASLKKELIKNNIKHPDIVLAQAKLETGNFTSPVLKKNNNLFGLRKGKRYYKFNHWTESVQAYRVLIQSKYDNGSYYKFLKELPYAEDPDYISKLKEFV